MEDERRSLLTEEIQHIRRAAPKVWADFKGFIQRGNFFDLATAMVVGTAFAAVVTSFVNDLFTPIVSLALTMNLKETFIVLRSGPNPPYNTREQATQDGAITFNYGNFVQVTTEFLIVSVCFWLLFKVYTKVYDNLERSR